jgi:ABC-type branched-subunit amino acid transport system ATPase component
VQYLDLLGIVHLRHKLVGELSTGQRRLAELSAVLSLEPKVLLLDEPSAGIAHSEVQGLTDVFRRIHGELDVTLVIIEHDLALLADLATRMVAMELGKVIADGTPAEVRSHPRVVRSYLGDEPNIAARSGALGTAPQAVPSVR